MEYIDLGLSVLWADRNIGADKPEDYGDHLKWRDWERNIQVPTIDQFQELIDKCTWEWITYNGVNGYKVTSKSNRNSIFLPAAGSRYGTSLYGAGRYGDYWSSMLYISYSNYAYDLYFNSDDHGVSDGYRFYGQSVRPVKEKNG